MPEENRENNQSKKLPEQGITRPLCGDCETIGTNNLCGNPDSPFFRGRVNNDMAGCAFHRSAEPEPENGNNNDE